MKKKTLIMLGIIGALIVVGTIFTFNIQGVTATYTTDIWAMMTLKDGREAIKHFTVGKYYRSNSEECDWKTSNEAAGVCLNTGCTGEFTDYCLEQTNKCVFWIEPDWGNSAKCNVGYSDIGFDTIAHEYIGEEFTAHIDDFCDQKYKHGDQILITKYCGVQEPLQDPLEDTKDDIEDAIDDAVDEGLDQETGDELQDSLETEDTTELENTIDESIETTDDKELLDSLSELKALQARMDKLIKGTCDTIDDCRKGEVCNQGYCDEVKVKFNYMYLVFAGIAIVLVLIMSIFIGRRSR